MPKDRPLPILTLKVPEQRYTCRSCGRCCKHFTVQLRDEDIKRLDDQNWYERLGERPYHEFRGSTFLKQRADRDRSCIFLQPNGLCRIHTEFGFTHKPLACRMFPFTLMPNGSLQAIQLGLSFACPSVIENHGRPLLHHLNDVKQMARAIPELHAFPKQKFTPVEITANRPASRNELEIITNSFDNWISRPDIPLHHRLLGAVIFTSTIQDAVAHEYSEHDFEEVANLTFEQLEDELPDLDPAPPSTRHLKQLRQLVYAHIEDPKISEVKKTGIRAHALGQLKLNSVFSRGRGEFPVRFDNPKSTNVNTDEYDWPASLTFEMANTPSPASAGDDDRPEIDFLLIRYLRARILGHRAFGSGYYKFTIVDGLNALWLMIAATGWLARLHAGANNRNSITFPDLEAALLRTDRHAGRAPWLGRSAEKLRLKFFTKNHGILRTLHALRIVEDGLSNGEAT